MQTPRVRLHNDIVRRVRGEFLEMPGLRITEAQARRLWSLDSALCAKVLGDLVETGFLLKTRDGAFVRVDAANPVKTTRPARARKTPAA
ncbi:MAG: hypothetical protein AB7Q29_03945 [Vicinamibacterales bacterium]